MKHNWKNKIFGGLSLTAAMFIFQACYGTPQDFGLDVLIEGQVKSGTSGLPVKGIKVSIVELPQYLYTDGDGKFSFYTESADTITVKFEDTDSSQNGSFAGRDTIITGATDRVYLDIVLKEE
jgi:hypothetical protein